MFEDLQLLESLLSCSDQRVLAFAQESNRIEGIRNDDADTVHAQALTHFLQLTTITTTDVTRFVHKIQFGAKFRLNTNDRVWIGGREAPSASVLKQEFPKLLRRINVGLNSQDLILPVHAHALYEFLHPFTDGNGRSGRALWLWQMVRQYRWRFQLPFLHQYYYQTLDAMNVECYKGQQINVRT